MNSKAGKSILGIVILIALAGVAWFAFNTFAGSQSKAQDELAQPDPSAPKGGAPKSSPKHAKP